LQVWQLSKKLSHLFFYSNQKTLPSRHYSTLY
jgi:hypothetical protein